ncbi:MAG: hypothetical protein AB1601_15495 [Planctomycetota bacterium]
MGKHFAGVCCGSMKRVPRQRCSVPGPSAALVLTLSGVGELHRRPAVLGEWAQACRREQPAQLIFRHGPPFVPPVGLLIAFSQPGEGVRRQPSRVDAPRSERRQCRQVRIDHSGAHASRFRFRRPAFHRVAVQVAQVGETAAGNRPVQTVPHVGNMPRRNKRLPALAAFRAQVLKVGVNVRRKRGSPVVERRVFRGRQRPTTHPVGAFLKLGEHDQSRVCASAAGRHLAHPSGAVAELGRERPRFDKYAVGAGVLAVGRRRHLRGALAAPAVGPVGEAFALAREHFRVRRQRLRVGFAEHDAHDSPFPPAHTPALNPEVRGELVGRAEPQRRFATKESRQRLTLDARRPLNRVQRFRRFGQGSPQKFGHRTNPLVHVSILTRWPGFRQAGFSHAGTLTGYTRVCVYPFMGYTVIPARRCRSERHGGAGLSPAPGCRS